MIYCNLSMLRVLFFNNEKAQDTELKELAMNIKNSLGSAEELLSSILELTKLDSLVLQMSEFAASSLVEPLRNDYEALAREKGLKFIIEPVMCACIPTKRCYASTT